ncbi:MAG: hypothetical protein ACREIO_07305 [Nitrospiraceae bacterium]
MAEQFVRHFLSHDLNILFEGLPGALSDAINGVLLHQDSDLLRQLGPSGCLGDALTDEMSLGQDTMSGRDQELVIRVTGLEFVWLGRRRCGLDRITRQFSWLPRLISLLFLAKLLKELI